MNGPSLVPRQAALAPLWHDPPSGRWSWARRRGRHAAAGYLASVAAGPAATLEALASASLLAADELTAQAMRDPDPVMALWSARSLASPSGELPTVPRQRKLLRSSPGGGPAEARRNGDLGPVYRAALGGAGRPRQIAAALHGLGDDHDDSLPATAVPFLTIRARLSAGQQRKRSVAAQMLATSCAAWSRCCWTAPPGSRQLPCAASRSPASWRSMPRGARRDAGVQERGQRKPAPASAGGTGMPVPTAGAGPGCTLAGPSAGISQRCANQRDRRDRPVCPVTRW